MNCARFGFINGFADRKEPPMSNQIDQNHITRGFNIAVFAICAAIGIFTFLASHVTDSHASITGLFLISGADSLRYLAVALIAALVVRVFWNRLVANLFAVRSINYAEALAVVLVKGLLFSI
jgi:hypothetical protein